MIFSAVELCKTIMFPGDMHVLSSTLWCTAMGKHFSLTPALLIAHNTVFPRIGENWHMLRIKQTRVWWSCWPTRTHGGVTILRKSTDLPDNFLSEFSLRVASYPSEVFVVRKLGLVL